MRPQADRIRNFCIIAHIDHGKSTLADRLLENTGTVQKRDMQAQLLDSMDLERERGITIKSKAIRLEYEYKGETYYLNLIDTPGHVDFTYEVSRSLRACEGAILVVDATQGMQAQTISNLYLAMGAELEILPILNKIDLPSAQPDMFAKQVGELMGIDPDIIPRVSAKAGIGITELLEKIVEFFPAPKAEREIPLRAFVFDSVYDSYRGGIAYVRVVEGTLKKGMKLRYMRSGGEYDAIEIGILTRTRIPCDELSAGEVGYLVGNVRNLSDIKTGDTLTDMARPAAEPLPGYREVKPMVFAGLYPIDPDDYSELRESLEKLQLNDSAISFVPETSGALGFGFRCGFLGLLHMEVVQERLDREFNMNIITTAPGVEYHVTKTDGEVVLVDNPSQLPSPNAIDSIAEPWIKAQIFTPSEYIGNIHKLCNEKRGVYLNTSYISEIQVTLEFELPMGEVMFDFFDRLKSATKGYASLDYDEIGYREGDLNRLDILLNGDPVDAFSVIIHREKAFSHGMALCEKLKELIPRQQFDIAIQAALANKIIARTTVKALRKDVTAKCYGGDISRKRKLLEKQKEGKKRMKSIGSVEVPQEAFLAVLDMGGDN
ncbi:MAG: elongation factor 4 [Fibrobacteres bacterium]|nr:elongation factor 4 [Fibrobacterota bacterium]